MVNGVINLYKPIGPTSFDMVQFIKKTVRVKKAGHIGTLDPMAEGILPVCINQGTKLVQFLVHLPKVYTATFVLGVATDTQDATGKTLATHPVEGITDQDIQKVLKEFIGEQLQVPPMYSAKKRNGTPLYKLARSGITVDREPVTIRIDEIQFIRRVENRVTIRVHCAAGTYIRSLCHDIGQKLGCGAHMSELVRERVGPFHIENSQKPEEVTRIQQEGQLESALHSMEQSLDFIPEIRIKKDRIPAIQHGAAVTKSFLEDFPERFHPGMNFRVHDEENQLVAIVEPVIDQSRVSELDSRDIAFKLKRVFN